MSKQRKSDLEQVLEHLVNEDTDKAESLLHEYIVAKSRSIYESVVNEEDNDCDDMDDDVENDQEDVKEDIGGDEKEDFIGDIEADGDDIDSDEVNNGEVENGEYQDGEADEDMSQEDRMEDLESQLAQLRTEFETLMNQEMEEPYHDESDFSGEYDDAGEGDMDSDMDMEMDMDMDPNRIQEATKLQDEVSVCMDKEGQYVGTGKNSKSGKVNTKSIYSDAARKERSGPGPVDFTKGSNEKGGTVQKPKDHTPSDNIGQSPSNVNGTYDEDESGYVGTGKNSKRGKVNTQSILSKRPTN
jgi:hypothetical protein